MTKEEVLKKSIGFISLGCDKNRVDLEKIMFNLKNAGFTLTTNFETANIIIINTCSFIESARKESVESILEMAQLKNLHCEKIIVTGCLNEMKYADLEMSLPEVDKFIKVSENNKIVNIIFKLYDVNIKESVSYDCGINRVISTPAHYSYLKISEGCNNFCSYCTIPFIRGRFTSEKMENLIKEAEQLADAGVKEIILVGQDVTKYGYDLYGKSKLVELIQALSKIKKIKWIRLLYCYPELVDDALINEIKNNKKVVKYIDIPMQHVNSNILKSMNRKTNRQQLIDLITKLKREIPNICIRSTFILGFPGETKKQFNELLTFLKEYKLNNVGFFAYSKEEGTLAFSMKHQIPNFIKKARVKKAYDIQKKISYLHNLSLLNKNLTVIIDDVNNDCFVGRTQFSAPDVDPVVYVSGNAHIGDIVNVRVTNATNYDLEGEIHELTK